MTPSAFPTIDDKGLRWFAVVFAGLIFGVLGLLLPYLLGRTWPDWPWWPWIVGAVVLFWGLISPSTFRHFYRLWMRFGQLMNWIVTRLVLAFVFYVVILPIGLFMRIRSKDPLRRRWDRAALSYRVKSVANAPQHMERPF